MSDGSKIAAPDPDWPTNYFNYYTEIEEHFQRARGTGLFLLSPLDWALLESWRMAGVPLAAVLKGIDAAFEKWRSRKQQKRRMINSIAYCAQAVLEAAERLPAPGVRNPTTAQPLFTVEELRAHLKNAAEAISRRREPIFGEISRTLASLAEEAENRLTELEDLERRLSSLEEKLIATLRSAQTDEELYAIRAALDAELKPYRSKMTADQLAMLERRYLDTALLERAKLPRLSLFYLH